MSMASAAAASSVRPLYWLANLGANDPEYLTLPQGFSPTFSFASDIADDGTIIGHGRQGSSTNIIRWNKPGSTHIPFNVGSPAGNQAFALAYSNAKRIAGIAVFTSGGQWQAYVTGVNAQDFDGVSGLGTFGGLQSEAMEVHDLSGTVGWAHCSSGRRRAFHVPIGATSVAGHELPRLEDTSSTTLRLCVGLSDPRLGFNLHPLSDLQIQPGCQTESAIQIGILAHPNPVRHPVAHVFRCHWPQPNSARKTSMPP